MLWVHFIHVRIHILLKHLKLVWFSSILQNTFCNYLANYSSWIFGVETNSICLLRGSTGVHFQPISAVLPKLLLHAATITNTNLPTLFWVQYGFPKEIRWNFFLGAQIKSNHDVFLPTHNISLLPQWRRSFLVGNFHNVAS